MGLHSSQFVFHIEITVIRHRAWSSDSAGKDLLVDSLIFGAILWTRCHTLSSASLNSCRDDSVPWTRIVAFHSKDFYKNRKKLEGWKSSFGRNSTCNAMSEHWTHLMLVQHPRCDGLPALTAVALRSCVSDEVSTLTAGSCAVHGCRGGCARHWLDGTLLVVQAQEIQLVESTCQVFLLDRSYLILQ